MDFLAGKLLIAVPDLPDSNFYRSVVFMIEHNADGAMGVILNRPTNMALGDWKELATDMEVSRQDKIFVGGPVEGPILALHDQFSITDNEVHEGIYLTTSSDRLSQLVTNAEVRLKLFSGYSGWGPGQLEMELECGGWLVCAAHNKDIFADSETLWKSICERFGHDIMLPSGVKRDGDPNLN